MSDDTDSFSQLQYKGLDFYKPKNNKINMKIYYINFLLCFKHAYKGNESLEIKKK